jgi:hypothetical protein
MKGRHTTPWLMAAAILTAIWATSLLNRKKKLVRPYFFEA